jgi:glycosyltransferase involved in cell wall biosynthesis
VNHAIINGLDEHKNFSSLVREFAEYVDQFKPDVVHANMNWQLLIAVAVKYLYGKKYSIVYTVHGYRHNYRFRSIIARYLIGLGLHLFANRIITPSSFLKSKFSFLGQKNRLLFIGADESFFVEYKPPSFDTTKRVIFPAEFREGKNQDLLIRVIKKYINKTGDTNIELYLPGTGEKLEDCKALSKALGLEDKVFFPGFIDRSQMLKYYLTSQFAIIPSNVETFGNCIAEPYVLGRVIISRHVGVADDIIVQGETGFLYSTEEELLKTLFDVLPDRDKCSSVSRNAFSGRDVFRWDNICRDYLKLIDDLNPS